MAVGAHVSLLDLLLQLPQQGRGLKSGNTQIQGRIFCVQEITFLRRGEGCAGCPGDNPALGRAGRQLLAELAGLLCVSMLFRLGDGDKRMKG